MINFSDLSSHDVTSSNFNSILKNLEKSKDSFLKTLSENTGLSVDYLDPIYESKLYMNNGDVDSTIEGIWDEYINLKTKQTDVDQLDEEFITLLSMFNKKMNSGKDVIKMVPETKSDIKKKRSFMKSIINWIKREFNNNDTDDALDILSSLSQMRNIEIKNGNKSYDILFEGYTPRIDKRLENKYGNQFLNIKKTAIDNFSTLAIGEDFIDDNLYFYKDLKYILTDIWKSCDTSERKDVYSRLVKFIDNQIEYYVNKSNTEQIDESNYSEFLYSLINSPSLNAMYFSPDYLKTVTSDYQTLLYDLVYIVDRYVQNSQKYMDYVDITKISNYKKAYALINKSIISSNVSSSIAENVVDYGLDNQGRYHYNQLANDCLLIIKSIQNEFNVGLRKVINLYITSSLELLHTLKFMETRLNNFRFTIS